ncbi:LacI family DNA-binding transcriptional regulator [Amphibiibacter pelophylacis]|uniref:LacI family DNA-binding transcriptional regulator n=1 Tax=Amphibiibacter pelophylacis TaxID=1799477 RepID=A0ACC6P423_9BURK
MTTKHTTLAEIARAVGLHVSTVSRVLNSSEAEAVQAASADSVQRIRKVAEAMGYRPNQLARSLKSQRTRLAGVLMPGVTDHVLAQIYEAIEIEGTAHGYESIVANTHDRPELQERRSLLLLDRRVDGLILGDVPHHGGYAHALHERRVPFVLVSRHAGDFPCVVADDYGGGRAMAHHFADLGHRDVAVLAGRPWASTGIERTRGFVAGMAERGVTLLPERIVATDFTNESGYQVSRELLRRDPAITALFATNDFDALGVYGAAHELGRAPGEDLALGGFNNIAITAHLGVPMTTIDSPRQQMGQRAMRMLIDLIKGRSNGERLFLPTQLVVRATSCPPRS